MVRKTDMYFRKLLVDILNVSRLFLIIWKCRAVSRVVHSMDLYSTIKTSPEGSWSVFPIQIFDYASLRLHDIIL